MRRIALDIYRCETYDGIHAMAQVPANSCHTRRNSCSLQQALPTGQPSLCEELPLNLRSSIRKKECWPLVFVSYAAITTVCVANGSVVRTQIVGHTPSWSFEMRNSTRFVCGMRAVVRPQSPFPSSFRILPRVSGWNICQTRLRGGRMNFSPRASTMNCSQS